MALVTFGHLVDDGVTTNTTARPRASALQNSRSASPASRAPGIAAIEPSSTIMYPQGVYGT